VIQNDVADAVYKAASIAVQKHGKTDVSVSQLLDLITGVENYDPKNTHKQGFIGKCYYRESIGKNIEFQAYISEFWFGVFSNLQKAKLSGEEMVNGKKTQMNPVNWLRSRGVFAVRKLVYGMRMKQFISRCGDCHTTVPAYVKHDDKCRKCNSDLKILYSDGGMTRGKCMSCNVEVRLASTYQCKKCGSANIVSTSKIKLGPMNDDVNGDTTAEEKLIEHEDNIGIRSVLQRAFDTLPINKKSGTSQTRVVFKIITDANCADARAVCAKCNLEDKKTCGASAFDLTDCYNYSKKLAEYLGYTQTLANARVQRSLDVIRKAAIEEEEKCRPTADGISPGNGRGGVTQDKFAVGLQKIL
jgi:ubiquitin